MLSRACCVFFLDGIAATREGMRLTLAHLNGPAEYSVNAELKAVTIPFHVRVAALGAAGRLGIASVVSPEWGV